MTQKQVIKDYTWAEVQGDLGMFLEKRMSYDGSDLEYVGYNREPNAATDDLSWFIIKNTYAAGDITRYQLPDDGPQFKYSWDDRATYYT